MSSHLIPKRETESVVHIRTHSGSRALRQRVTEYEGSILDLLERPKWFAEAKCRGVGGDLAHPTTGGRPERSPARQFIRIYCNHCKVTRQCLEYALDFEASTGPVGVWGGYTSYERRRMVRKRKGKPTHTELEARGLLLHAQGLTCLQIAERMGMHIRTVEGWVKAAREAP